MPRGGSSTLDAGTRPERLFAMALKGALRRHLIEEIEREPRDLGGACPDFFWRHRGLAVYVDGCQWHGCPEHFRPHGNPAHGLAREAVARQRVVDRVSRDALRASGRMVLAFWEHEILADANACARRVARELG